MASQVKPHSPMSPSARQAVKVKSYVDLQLEKTRTQVKIVDLIGGVLVLVAFALGFLLVATMVDAWIWPLSSMARWGCLFILIAGGVTYSLLAIAPLLFKRINPDYAAKMIEDAKPSFQNSLLNYVSIRRKPEAVRTAVFDAVSRQAASDLATVPSDATVDRSKLIRLGFVLIGLTVVAVGYKMVSPKDPLQSIARIFAPGAKISNPSFVKISNVTPGDAQIFFGEHLTVTAEVRGQYRQDDVFLTYSTSNGQLVNQRIQMSPTEMPFQFEAEISMFGKGIQQSLEYAVAANDGSSPNYEVTVRSNPTITIESLELVPPKYTKIQPTTLIGQGDIHAIEGTKVTVHAVANMPIKMATIELLQETTGNSTDDEPDPEQSYQVISTPIQMSAEGKSAVGYFQVALNSTRSRPFATHYRVRFTSSDGDRNDQPNVYPIRVIPDLAPEVVIKSPFEQNVEVAENGSLLIEVEAHDLDFEIESVALHIEHRGLRIVDTELAKKQVGNRVLSQFRLSPAKLGLKSGDQIIFFVTAADNRISSFSEQPDPNVTQTDNHTVTVTEIDDQIKPPQDNPENKDSTGESKDGDESEGSKDEPGGNDGDESEGSKDEPGGNDGDESEGSKDESGGNDGDESEGAKDEPGGNDGDESEGAKDEPGGNDGDESEGSKDESGGNDGDESEGAKDEPGGNDGDESEGSKDEPGGNDGGGSEGSKDDQGGSGGAKDEQGGSNGGGSKGAKDEQSGGDGAGTEGAKDEQAGNNGGGSNGGKSNASNGEGGDGQKDDSLTEGDPQALSKDASPGEQMRELKKHFDSQPSDSEAENQQKDVDSGEADSNEDESTGGDSKGDDSKGGDSKGGDSKGGDSKGGDSKGGDSKGGDSKGGDSKGGDSKGDDSQGGDSKDGDSKGGDSKGGDSKGGDSKGGDSKGGGSNGGGSDDRGKPKNQDEGDGSPSSAGNGTGNASSGIEEIGREEPNQEHAKEAVDMILHDLSEQQFDPDPDLLKKMNWTKEDLNQFLARWEEMKRKAEEGDLIAKRKYEKSLKSLGIRPKSQIRSVSNNRDKVEDLAQDSEVNEPPADRTREFESFLKGLNRSR